LLLILHRQALAIEADYNKECNLAICLMKTGKLTGSKYLLQAIPYNSDDESHVKSLSRATEMLRELELQSLPSPITQVKYKESRILLAADMGKVEDLQPPMLSTPLTQLKYEEPHISVPSGRQKHEDYNSWFPSPITQLKREEPHILVTASGEKNEDCGGYQDLSRLFNDAATPQSTLEKLRKRLVKEAPKTSTNDQIQTPAPTECMPHSEGITDASEKPVQERKLSTKSVRKTWADMVDEDEQQLGDDKTWAGLVGEEKCNWVTRSQQMAWAVHRKMKAASMEVSWSIRHHRPIKEVAPSKNNLLAITYIVLQLVHGDTVTPKPPRTRT
jgi:hypothetical protein